MPSQAMQQLIDALKERQKASASVAPPTLEALDRGAVCSIAGIHLSDVPRLDYIQKEELL